MTFTDTERAILRIVQDNIPETLTPFADIAREVGTSEQEVIDLLVRMRDSGAIRRFGASLRHQQTEWTHNVMVGWRVSDENIDAAGREAAQHPNVSHCYWRPSSVEDFPYTLFTMVHGRSDEECARTIETLASIHGLEECVQLKTEKELKKISMMYF